MLTRQIHVAAFAGFSRPRKEGWENVGEGQGRGHTGLKLATECLFAAKKDFGEIFVGVYVQI